MIVTNISSLVNYGETSEKFALDDAEIAALAAEALGLAPAAQPSAPDAAAPVGEVPVVVVPQSWRSSRPTIDISDRQLDDLAAAAVAAIVTFNAANPKFPLLYVRNGSLTYLVRNEHGHVLAREVTSGALTRILADAATWVETRQRKNGQAVVFQRYPPSLVATYILSMETWPFPRLVGVASGPTFAPDGSLHEAIGYDFRSQIFNSVALQIGDTTPTAAAVSAAKKLIFDDLFVDFPFDSQASRANALAFLLLPFVRPMIPRVTPLHLIDAPDAGTGKGLLADLCGIVTTGSPIPAAQACETDDEWRKRITSSLADAGQYIFFDNIPQGREFGSGVFASALTQEFYEDRILGRTENTRHHVRCTWCASGNNVLPTREIARRCVWIRLDANAESAYDRSQFKHALIRDWAESHRAELVAACITLVRKWLSIGQPAYSGKLLGSYEGWTRVMGGILEAAGVAGFLENRRALFDEAGSEFDAIREFVQVWHERHGQAVTESTDLFRIASYPDDPQCADIGDWTNVLGDFLGAGKQPSRATRFGKFLSTYKDRVVGGLKIRQDKPARGKGRWHLEAVKIKPA